MLIDACYYQKDKNKHFLALQHHLQQLFKRQEHTATLCYVFISIHLVFAAIAAAVLFPRLNQLRHCIFYRVDYGAAPDLPLPLFCSSTSFTISAFVFGKLILPLNTPLTISFIVTVLFGW
jgi:hypothetical protein